jgi:hypothetical protein
MHLPAGHAGGVLSGRSSEALPGHEDGVVWRSGAECYDVVPAKVRLPSSGWVMGYE